MNVIWKIKLLRRYHQSIEIPKDSKILCVKEQYNEICMWFKCDPANELEKRLIAFVPTGEVCPDDNEKSRYLGTLHGELLILHVFEKLNREQ